MSSHGLVGPGGALVFGVGPFGFRGPFGPFGLRGLLGSFAFGLGGSFPFGCLAFGSFPFGPLALDAFGALLFGCLAFGAFAFGLGGSFPFGCLAFGSFPVGSGTVPLRGAAIPTPQGVVTSPGVVRLYGVV